MSDKIIIRYANEDDAETLLKIYEPYVKNTAVTFEYEVPSVEEFKRRIKLVKTKYPYLVAESDGETVGYAYASRFKERAAYDRAVEVSIYVKHSARRKGIGKRLYAELEKDLKEQGILNLNACVAYAENEDEYLSNDSFSFHEALGFEIVAHFHKCGYKFGRWYDMVWLEKLIGDHPEIPEIK